MHDGRQEEAVVGAGCDVRIAGRRIARIEVVAHSHNRSVPHPDTHRTPTLKPHKGRSGMMVPCVT